MLIKGQTHQTSQLCSAVGNFEDSHSETGYTQLESNQYLSTSTFFLERRKKERKYQMSAVMIIPSYTWYSWGFQFCSELSWVHQTDDRSIIPSVWNLQFPTDRTDTDVNIPSCLPGIDPILISGWPSSLWLSCHSVLWCCRQFNLPSQECECSEFSLPAIDKSISILIKLGIWVGPLC